MSGPGDWLVRPVRQGDIDALIALAEALGPGMTTLPAHGNAIARKINQSLRTFAGHAAEDSQYILVLEDRSTRQVLGLSGVYPRIGDAYGFFSYKLTRLIQRSVDLGRRYEIELLTLSNDYTGATEVGTLAVLPGLQGSGAGRLLARARYMLIGAFPHLFAPRVMAEMRGWQDADGSSPFWDAIGARFFGMDFNEADKLSAVQGAGFIADLMPKQPIYTALLSEAARAAIGRPHAVSARAMAMLTSEGFRYEAHVDVFDGGPQVHALRDEIRTVLQGRVVRLGCAAGDVAPMLVSNTELVDFRVVHAAGRATGDVLELEPDAAARLGADPGTALRFAPG